MNHWLLAAAGFRRRVLARRAAVLTGRACRDRRGGSPRVPSPRSNTVRTRRSRNQHEDPHRFAGALRRLYRPPPALVRPVRRPLAVSERESPLALALQADRRLWTCARRV